MCGEIDKNSSQSAPPAFFSRGSQARLGPDPALIILDCKTLGKLLNSAGSFTPGTKQGLNQHLFAQ